MTLKDQSPAEDRFALDDRLHPGPADDVVGLDGEHLLSE
jgi:hypothetical protein